MSFFKDFKADFTQAMNELMPDGNEVYDDVVEEDLSSAKSEVKKEKASKQKPKKTKTKEKKTPVYDNTDIAPEDMSDQIDELLDNELYGDGQYQEEIIHDDVDVNTMDMSVEELLRQLDAGMNDTQEDVSPVLDEDIQVESVESVEPVVDDLDASIKDMLAQLDEKVPVEQTNEEESDQIELEEVLVEDEDALLEAESDLGDISEMSPEDILRALQDDAIPESEESIVSENVENLPLESSEALTEEVPVELEEDASEVSPAEVEEDASEASPAEVEDDTSEASPVEVEEDVSEASPVEVQEEVPEASPVEVQEEVPEALQEDTSEELPDEDEIEVEFYEEEPDHTDSNITNSIVNVEGENMEDKDVISIKSADEKTVKPAVEETRYNVEEAASDTTYITKGTKISGSIETDASIDIIGVVEGDVNCKGKVVVGGAVKGAITAGELYCNSARIDGDIKSYGSVKVGVGSMIIGNVEGESAVIAGAVNGDIDVKGPVIVDSTAVIMGNIKSRSVQINNGAVIEGFCSQSYSDIDVKSFFA